MTAHCKGVPRPKPGPAQVLVQLGAGEWIDCLICSEQYLGVQTHWCHHAGKKGRSQRCTEEEGECQGCTQRWPKRWKGFLHVYDLGRKKDCFVEITPGIGADLDLQCPPGETLRGLRLKMRRGEAGKKTRVEVVLSPWTGSLDGLPDEKDPLPLLESLWAWGR